jgi:thiamine pyrophosphate-dependent acetolactate synthase large subunit-like protein
VAITRDEMIEILAEADPVGLVAAGAPRDEYAAEAEEILTLHGIPQLTEITGVFAVSFSNPGACSREVARWIVEEMARRAG